MLLSMKLITCSGESGLVKLVCPSTPICEGIRDHRHRQIVFNNENSLLMLTSVPKYASDGLEIAQILCDGTSFTGARQVGKQC